MEHITTQDSYSIENYLLKNYTTLSVEQSEEILTCRNDDRIRKWMFNAQIIEQSEHFEFIKTLKQTRHMHHWGVYKNDVYVASVNISTIDLKNRSCVWGYFLNPKYLGSGMGIDIEFIMLQLLFGCFKFQSIAGYVNQSNTSALSLHKVFGYTTSNSDIANHACVKLTQATWSKLPQSLSLFKVYAIKQMRNKQLTTNKR